MALIEVKNLEKTYADEDIKTQALRGVSFSIESGEFVAIMGPSGSGKSTLLHVLGFLDRETSGTYHFNGRSNADFSPEELALLRNQKLGFVFQSFNLLSRTSVFDNVRLPLMYSEVPEAEWDERTEEAIVSVGLWHRRDHEPSKLSGGEKQRAAIARALIMRPQVIFADEPTGNLDSVSGKQVMKILQELNEKSGHTIILITHETYTAEHAGRIIRLLDGKIDSDELVTKRRTAVEDFIK
ncbi:MAG: ABC transporter ATP-binding protein [Candidatus Lloydbacteria bacterium]|nr:ABC transporter ATP-binding protein [Candidatus Lloydbacteria bacterium]